MEIKVSYDVDGRAFEGVLVCDDDAVGKGLPVLFMQPDWYGVCAETIAQAHELAEGRYVVLLADMFGKDYGGDAREFNDLLQGMIKVHTNLAFKTACGAAAYEALLAEAIKLGVYDDKAPKFAVGYCAGGGFLVEQARTGADFDALVVLHITNPNPLVPGTPCNIKGRVLSIHGSADPVTTREAMDIFEAELTEAGVEWQTLWFGGAVHSFCVPSANFPGAVYDAKLCRRSYALMHDFFAEGA